MNIIYYWITILLITDSILSNFTQTVNLNILFKQLIHGFNPYQVVSFTSNNFFKKVIPNSTLRQDLPSYTYYRTLKISYTRL